ncbi:hypothetical protein BDV33DRAFT_185129, partial [Aspergillus novoparasiticus]
YIILKQFLFGAFLRGRCFALRLSTPVPSIKRGTFILYIPRGVHPMATMSARAIFPRYPVSIGCLYLRQAGIPAFC